MAPFASCCIFVTPLLLQARLIRPPEISSFPSDRPPLDMKQARVILEDINDALDTDRHFRGPEGDNDEEDDEIGEEDKERGTKCCVEGCR